MTLPYLVSAMLRLWIFVAIVITVVISIIGSMYTCSQTLCNQLQFGAYFMPLPLWNYNRPRIKFFLLLLRRACDRPATYIKCRIIIFHVSWDLLKTAPFDLLPQWPQRDVSLIIPCAVSFDESSCLSNSNSIFLFVLSVYPSASQIGCLSDRLPLSAYLYASQPACFPLFYVHTPPCFISQVKVKKFNPEWALTGNNL